MSIAQGSNTRFSYIEEVTPGTTPSTPEFSSFPINDFSLTLSKDTFTDPSIRSDRQVHYMVHGNYKLGGDISVTLMGLGADPTGNSLFDPWFESALNSAWTSNVLKVGNTTKSFTFEKTITDSAGVENHFRYKGVQITGFSFDVALNAPVKAKFTTAGLNEDPISTVEIVGATYLAEPAAGQQPLIHINSNNVFKEGGSATSLMTAFSLNLTNASNVNSALGSAQAISITSGRAAITGSATYYFSDAALYNKFKNETISSIEVKLSDGTHSYTFLVPKIKYQSATQVINNEGTVMVTMPFTALYSDAEQSTLVITRA